MTSRPLSLEAQTRKDRFLENASPEVHQFFDYWLSIRHGSQMPRKADFDPVAVPNLLSILWIHRYLKDEQKFVSQLAGDLINTAWRKNSIAGNDVATLINEDDYPAVFDRWVYMIETPAIFYGPNLTYKTGQHGRTAERIVAPITDDEGKPTFIIGISLYSSTSKHEDYSIADNRNGRFLSCQDC